MSRTRVPPKSCSFAGPVNDRSPTKFSLCLLRPMPKIIADTPASLNSVLHEEIARTKTDASSIVTAALAQYLKTPVHTLFQVSTSGAPVTADFFSSAMELLLSDSVTCPPPEARRDAEPNVSQASRLCRGSMRLSRATPKTLGVFRIRNCRPRSSLDGTVRPMQG